MYAGVGVYKSNDIDCIAFHNDSPPFSKVECNEDDTSSSSEDVSHHITSRNDVNRADISALFRVATIVPQYVCGTFKQRNNSSAVMYFNYDFVRAKRLNKKSGKFVSVNMGGKLKMETHITDEKVKQFIAVHHLGVPSTNFVPTMVQKEATLEACLL